MLRMRIINDSTGLPAGIIVLGGMEDIAPDHTGNVAQVNDAENALEARLAKVLT